MNALFMEIVKPVGHAIGAGIEKGIEKSIEQIGMEQEKKKGVQMEEIKSGINLISTTYDWHQVDKNMNHTGRYLKALLPVAAMTFAAYVTLPVIVGAVSFAVTGTGASAITYTVSNGVILFGGVYKMADNITKITSDEEQHDGNTQQVQ